MEVVVVLAIILGILFVKALIDSKRTKEYILSQIDKRWGECPHVELTPERLQAIRVYYDATKRKDKDIDDITWNDIGMNDIFELLDNTSSTIGEEYLYATLRKVQFDKEELVEREKMVSYLQEHKKERVEIQEALFQMGKIKNKSFYKEFLISKELVKAKKIHILYCLALVACFVGLICLAILGSSLRTIIILTVLCSFHNIVQYYRRKAEIVSHYATLTYTMKLLYSMDLLLKLENPIIEPYRDRLQSVKNKFSGFRKKSRLVISGGAMSGSLADIILDYFRMFFHIDLIAFDSMISTINEKSEEIELVYEIIGKIDTAIAVASYRTWLDGDYCLPELTTGRSERLIMEDLYHPLIDNPVKNTIAERKSVLITGSNASGKSTFLKTVAVNAILAQTIHTCTCSRYSGNYYKIYSSMALNDNLLGNESYYIVEIKSLKRIIDQVEDNVPTLCFIDEVLRGTNTVERIAASSQILKYISRLNAICFAATHDIELTYILEGYLRNYHFQEEVRDKKVVFDYLLRTGRATTRNAIKLLTMLQYPEDVIENASQEVEHFMETGVWVE